MIALFQSQIPGPVTAEQLEQQKEKKAQQKKAKRQREKEKQADKLKANAFLLLTDEKKVNYTKVAFAGNEKVGVFDSFYGRTRQWYSEFNVF